MRKGAMTTAPGLSAIVLAAGKGTRMGPNVDKLFLELNGIPVVAHTWRRFDSANCIACIVLVGTELDIGGDAAARGVLGNEGVEPAEWGGGHAPP